MEYSIVAFNQKRGSGERGEPEEGGGIPGIEGRVVKAYRRRDAGVYEKKTRRRGEKSEYFASHVVYI